MWSWVRATRGTCMRFGKWKWSRGCPLTGGAVRHNEEWCPGAWEASASPCSLPVARAVHLFLPANSSLRCAPTWSVTGCTWIPKGQLILQSRSFPALSKNFPFVTLCWQPGAHSFSCFPTSSDPSAFTSVSGVCDLWLWFSDAYFKVFIFLYHHLYEQWFFH